LCLVFVLLLILGCNSGAGDVQKVGKKPPPHTGNSDPARDADQPPSPRNVPAGHSPAFSQDSKPFESLCARNLKIDVNDRQAEQWKLLKSELADYRAKKYARVSLSCTQLLIDPKAEIPKKQAATTLMCCLSVKFWGEIMKRAKGKLLYIGPLEGTAEAQVLKIKTDSGRIESFNTSTFTSRVEGDFKLGDKVEVVLFQKDLILVKKP